MWDLNADLGEGDPDMDALLLGIVTSANVACGGHAGDDESMARICAAAAESGVAVGAQVSYVDRDGFGRRRLDVAPDLLAEQIADQLGGLASHAQAAGTSVTYVKPHGALYHAAAAQEDVADAVLRGSGGLAVLTLPHGALRAQAEARGVAVHGEAFADRGYAADGGLIPRDQPGALLASTTAVAERVRRLVSHGEIVAVDGTILRARVRSICVHSDTPGAEALARSARDAIRSSGGAIGAFAPPGSVA